MRAKGESWIGFIRHAKAPELPVVLLEDVAALIGLVFALLGVGLTAVTGNPLFDALGTLMIGTLLIVVAITLGIETKSLLVGEGANEGDHAAIVRALESGDDPVLGDPREDALSRSRRVDGRREARLSRRSDARRGRRDDR